MLRAVLRYCGCMYVYGVYVVFVVHCSLSCVIIPGAHVYSFGVASYQCLLNILLLFVHQMAIKDNDIVQRSLSATEAQLAQSNANNSELQTEIGSLNTRLSELMKHMTRDSENTKKALEKAITASVRLCVVAPTVNVHVADKKLKFKAG